MTRLPKKRGITQVEEDKSLILRQPHAQVRSSDILCKLKHPIRSIDAAIRNCWVKSFGYEIGIILNLSD